LATVSIGTLRMFDSEKSSRRSFLLAASAAVATCAAPVSSSAVGDSDDDLLLDLTATQAVARMARGLLSVERYARVLLARCMATRALNAFITIEPERVLAEARTRDRELRADRPSVTRLCGRVVREQ
jgi:hypothetical protein